MDELCCNYCDFQISSEQDYFQYNEITLCEECYAAIHTAPIETPEEPDIEMEDLMTSLTIS